MTILDKTIIKTLSIIMTHREYFVYILSNRHHTVFYTGLTNELEQRVEQNKKKYIPKSFTARYNICKLLWFEAHNYLEEAIHREKTIKKWKRDWKKSLISELNPSWEDLSKDWSQ
jgi:putative endonuclease